MRALQTDMIGQFGWTLRRELCIIILIGISNYTGYVRDFFIAGSFRVSLVIDSRCAKYLGSL